MVEEPELSEACKIRVAEILEGDEWCELDIREKRKYVHCLAKKLRKEEGLEFGKSMKAAWDYFRCSCKGVCEVEADGKVLDKRTERVSD